MTTDNSGYHDCPCRDCFEIAIGCDDDNTPHLCSVCEDLGCDASGESECNAQHDHCDDVRIVLTDDGTMDTVLKCEGCGQEFRYNYQNDDEPRGDDSSAAYDRFVEESIADATEQHKEGN